LVDGEKKRKVVKGKLTGDKEELTKKKTRNLLFMRELQGRKEEEGRNRT